MKRKAVVLAGLLGLLLSARGAMGTLVTVYQETFDAGLGIWEDGAGPFAWSNSLGDPGGSATVVHQHTGGSASDASWVYWWSRPTAGNVITMPQPGTTVRLSYDFYQSASWTVYPGLAGWVHFTDSSSEWFSVSTPGTAGSWTHESQTLTYTDKSIASVEMFQMLAMVYNAPPVYIDNLTLAFDNINIMLDIPEPSVAALLGIGGLFLWRRRK
jgi:hypothetical protein